MSDTSGETIQADAGEGWYEWITPGMSLTRLAYVYESGRIYFPEGDSLDESDFLIAASLGNAHRLVRADALAESERALTEANTRIAAAIALHRRVPFQGHDYCATCRAIYWPQEGPRDAEWPCKFVAALSTTKENE